MSATLIISESGTDQELAAQAAIDEIFQNTVPVFAGVDIARQYVFLVNKEKNR